MLFEKNAAFYTFANTWADVKITTSYPSRRNVTDNFFELSAENNWNVNDGILPAKCENHISPISRYEVVYRDVWSREQRGKFLQGSSAGIFYEELPCFKKITHGKAFEPGFPTSPLF